MFGTSRSIKRRLTAINMLASAGALLVASTVFIRFEVESYRRNTVRTLSIQAQIIGANTASALLFADPETAGTTLSALAAAPNIKLAGIYTPAGEPFALYRRDGDGPALPPLALPAGEMETYRFNTSDLTLIRRIVFKDKPIGAVYIQSDLTEIGESLQRYGRIVASVLLLSLVVAFVISSFFQRSITRPLLALADTALLVSREKRFSLRAPPVTSRDEVALVVTTFNEMLMQIQQHEEERQKFVSLVEQTDDFIGMIGLDLRLIYVNPAGRRLAGLEASAAAGTPISALHPEHWWLKLRDEILPAIKRDDGNWSGEAQLCRVTDLQPIDVSMNLFPVHHPETNQLLCFASVMRDLTERKHLEEQLRQAQKLESIGQLAGGVAHDFNNLLVVISGYSEMLLDELPPGHRMRERVEQIARAGDKASALTRQLLLFSRRQRTELQNIAINDAVRSIHKLLGRLIGEDIEIVLSLEENAGVLRADTGQLEQVIMNLAVNARDAMPQGGKLLIETGHLFVDEDFARLHLDVTPDEYVTLSISDTGSGMTPEVKSRIFEPFFTTKDKGKGTGLGLSTVYGIVKQCGGSIWVYSEPLRGTVFRILFPSVSGVAQQTGPLFPEIKPASWTETILLAEDEEGVRAYVSGVLARYGFHVLQAENGSGALEIANSHAGPIHLLLTDAVMPGMSGPDLAKEFAVVRPGVPVLYMSGYSDRLFHEASMESNLIQKPFSISALINGIRKLLDQDLGRHEAASSGG
jgi:PAS domain S-box-containing protein